MHTDTASVTAVRRSDGGCVHRDNTFELNNLLPTYEYHSAMLVHLGQDDRLQVAAENITRVWKPGEFIQSSRHMTNSSHGQVVTLYKVNSFNYTGNSSTAIQRFCL